MFFIINKIKNIIYNNANIKIVLAIVIITYIFLIFPIFVNIKVKYLKSAKMLEYKIKLFSFITLFFGYVELIDEGIAIHVNDKKAILIFYKDIFSMRKRFKPLKDYHIFRLNANASIGLLDDEVQRLNFIIIYNFIFNIIGQCANQIKPYLKLKSNIALYEKEDLFSFVIKTTIVLNMLMILISLIKIVLEKIIYAIKSRTKPN